MGGQPRRRRPAQLAGDPSDAEPVSAADRDFPTLGKRQIAAAVRLETRLRQCARRIVVPLRRLMPRTLQALALVSPDLISCQYALDQLRTLLLLLRQHDGAIGVLPTRTVRPLHAQPPQPGAHEASPLHTVLQPC